MRAEPSLRLGEIVRFPGGHYDVRGIVDGRYVVRYRDESRGKESYRVWTVEERERFDANVEQRADLADRNGQIYERLLAGEPPKSLAAEFGLSTGRIQQICGNVARKERRRNRVSPSASASESSSVEN